MKGFWQVVWVWRPIEWDVDFQRIEYHDGHVGLTLFCFGPLRIGYHHLPRE